jgi:hypothetical protein
MIEKISSIWNSSNRKKTIFILLFSCLISCLQGETVFAQQGAADDIKAWFTGKPVPHQITVEEKLSDMLKGEHQLKAITSSQGGSSKGNISGGFFMFSGIGSGGIDGKSSSENGLYVIFSCKLNGEKGYRFFNKQIQTVTIEINDEIKEPTVRFGWNDRHVNNLNDVNIYITRVVITCREDQWSPIMEMPLSKKEK